MLNVEFGLWCLKGATRWGGLACVALSAAGCNGLSQDEVAVVIRWAECEECMSSELDSVTALGERAVGLLGALLFEGPPLERRHEYEQYLAMSHRQITAYAASRRSVSFDTSLEEYVQRYIRNYVVVYRRRAARALGEIGGTEARRVLDQAASTPFPEEVLEVVRFQRRRMIPE